MRVLFLVALLPLLSCRSSESDVVPVSTNIENKPQVEKPKVPIEVLPVAKGLNRFSLNLYEQSVKEGNLVISPFSVAAVLSLLELGSEGESAEALHRLLHTSDSKAYRQELHSLLSVLKGSEPSKEALAKEALEQAAAPTGYGKVDAQRIVSHTLNIRSSLWASSNESLRPEFTASAKALYNAKITSIDVTNPKESANQINAWVADTTKNKITSVVSPNTIHELTRLIIVNSVYFVGRWRLPFYPPDTSNKNFYQTGKSSPISVPTMKRIANFRFMQDEAVTMIEMPYWSESETTELAMVLVLPKERDGLDEIEKTLSLEILESRLAALTTQKSIQLHLPRWQAESAETLSKTLTKMGIGRIFNANADLGGISATPKLSIDELLHKAVINVDEKGTEAAAATASMLIGAGPAPEPIQVRMDHPFLYLIRDTKTGVILFIGRVTHPL